MSHTVRTQDVDRCPVCGVPSLEACVDADGNELPYDHPGRPRNVPDWLGRAPVKGE